MNKEEEEFVADLINQLSFDDYVNMEILQPLIDAKVEIPEQFEQKISELQEEFAELKKESLQLKIEALNPEHEYDNSSKSNYVVERPISTPEQLPITLENSKSASIFSMQSSYTRFLNEINEPISASPVSFAIPASSILRNSTPINKKRNPIEDFDNYTIPQLKLALQQFGIKYVNQKMAILQLQDKFEKEKVLPEIALTTYEIMTPERKDDIKYKIQKAIESSRYYVSIISFVPIDIEELHKEVKKIGVKISMDFFKEYLIEMGVQFCVGERRIGEQEAQEKGPRQLTLSENLKRKR